MKTKFRIDPIDDKGTLDLDYLNSKEYEIDSKTVEKYLTDEGFSEMEGYFIIEMLGKRWECKCTVL
jgi:hypothetical protein